jgi:hypothetical protein
MASRSTMLVILAAVLSSTSGHILLTVATMGSGLEGFHGFVLARYNAFENQ